MFGTKADNIEMREITPREHRNASRAGARARNRKKLNAAKRRFNARQERCQRNLFSRVVKKGK